jgi:hypothetical protein
MYILVDSKLEDRFFGVFGSYTYVFIHYKEVGLGVLLRQRGA